MKLTVRTKQRAAFAGMVVLLIAVGVAGITQAARLNNGANRMYDVDTQGMHNSGILAETTHEIVALSLESTLPLTPGETRELAATRRGVEDEIATAVANVQKIVAQAGGALPADLKTYEERRTAYLLVEKRLAEAVARGDEKTVDQIGTGELFKAFTPLDLSLHKLTEDFHKDAEATFLENDRIYRDARTLILGLLVAFVALGSVGVLLVPKPIAKLTNQVKEGAQTIGAATSQILVAVSQHTASASEQSAALGQTSTTVDEVRVTAEQAAQRAQDVAKAAQTSVQVSEDGVRIVEDIVSGMQDIREKVEAIAQDILALSEQTEQIGEITSTVNDLADQSNILALNATIEAAKAGEQGKGFAVVATEVKNLADQSRHATAQVQAILSEIQKGTNAAVLATEQGTKVVEGGVSLTGKAGEVIASLGDTVRETAQAAAQIAAAAHEQRVGMDQISQAMQDVSQMTQQFLSGAQQSQAAAESLNELASHLEDVTATY